MFVIAGIRSKFGMAIVVLMVGLALWQLVTGHVWVGLITLLIMAVTYARIPAAIGAALAVRHEPREPPGR